jgi:uncharacterized membrane protein
LLGCRPAWDGALLILFSFLAVVPAAIALRRSRATKKLVARIDALEREVRALRLGSVAPPPEPPPVATAAPIETPVETPIAAAEPALPAPEPIAPPETIRPAGALPPPAELWARVPTIDWERLFGVRAAAVLGGIALALAGLLFFKYSIEHGLIPPWLRVVIGTVVGVGCISAAEITLRRTYAGTANALAGAGIVVLYAAFWAASARYGLVPMGAGFVLMIAVTAAGCMLAARHASLEIALLGLAGGFATPLLLSTGADRPIGLFGYIPARRRDDVPGATAPLAGAGVAQPGGHRLLRSVVDRSAHGTGTAAARTDHPGRVRDRVCARRPSRSA